MTGGGVGRGEGGGEGGEEWEGRKNDRGGGGGKFLEGGEKSRLVSTVHTCKYEDHGTHTYITKDM